MIASIGYKIYEMRYYLILSLIISMASIPVANFFVIERDRNRNELFGEGFWIYGWGVYEKTDLELIAEVPPEWVRYILVPFRLTEILCGTGKGVSVDPTTSFE